jgi:hypothetical protein
MKTVAAALILPVCLLAACKKTPETAPEAAPVVVAAVPAPAPAPVAAPAAEPAEQTPEQRELAHKKELMDYAVMEDGYMNDARAQWAEKAVASSTYSETNYPAQFATGKLDNKYWQNANAEIGFDNIELSFAKPVSATEVRVVLPTGDGVQAISKIELQDTGGAWNTAWSGISDVKRDQRGDRTWFVRKFDKTAYKAKSVRVTFANNLEHVHKDVDAVQLVGE